MHAVGHLLLSVLGVTTRTRNLLGLDYSVSSSLTAEDNIPNITKSNIKTNVSCLSSAFAPCDRFAQFTDGGVVTAARVFVSNEADGSDVARSCPGCDAAARPALWLAVQLLGGWCCCPDASPLRPGPSSSVNSGPAFVSRLRVCAGRAEA